MKTLRQRVFGAGRIGVVGLVAGAGACSAAQGRGRVSVGREAVASAWSRPFNRGVTTSDSSMFTWRRNFHGGSANYLGRLSGTRLRENRGAGRDVAAAGRPHDKPREAAPLVEVTERYRRSLREAAVVEHPFVLEVVGVVDGAEQPVRWTGCSTGCDLTWRAPSPVTVRSCTSDRDRGRCIACRRAGRDPPVEFHERIICPPGLGRLASIFHRE